MPWSTRGSPARSSTIRWHPAAGPPAAEDSALNRFRARPVASVERVLDTVVDAHVAVARHGFVAVDFYDGCLMYDAATEQVRLVDLDSYRPGPYVLEADRQYGSRRFMAPEEFVRGSTIDERTTVYTLGRTARVLLGEAGHWRGSAAMEGVVERATADAPAARFESVGAFATAWFGSRA